MTQMCLTTSKSTSEAQKVFSFRKEEDEATFWPCLPDCQLIHPPTACLIAQHFLTCIVVWTAHHRVTHRLPHLVDMAGIVVAFLPLLCQHTQATGSGEVALPLFLDWLSRRGESVNVLVIALPDHIQWPFVVEALGQAHKGDTLFVA